MHSCKSVKVIFPVFHGIKSNLLDTLTFFHLLCAMLVCVITLSIMRNFVMLIKEFPYISTYEINIFGKYFDLLSYLFWIIKYYNFYMARDTSLQNASKEQHDENWNASILVAMIFMTFGDSIYQNNIYSWRNKTFMAQEMYF